MQIVSSTPIVFLMALLIMLRGPYQGLTILAAMLPFGMMAAVNLPAIGGMSLTSTDILLLTLFVMVLLRAGLRRDLNAIFAPGSMGLTLALLLFYATLASLFLPRVFAGATEVFNLSRQTNQDGFVSSPLRPSNANYSQLFRLNISLCAFLVTAVLVRRHPDPQWLLRLMKWMTAVHVTLGIVDLVSAETGMAWIMGPFRTANYALTLGQHVAGIRRMIGGFPEASTYGYFALGLFGFWLSHALSRRSVGDRSSDIWLALAAFALLRCTSSSAYVGAAGFVIVFSALQMRVGVQGVSRPVITILSGLIALLPVMLFSAYMAYQFSPSVSDFIDRALLDKMTSHSGVERMGLNMQAFRNFLDTHMLGAGMGSIRASNWVPAVLASLGLIGMLIILSFYARLFAATVANPDRESLFLVKAFKMGCLALIMRSLVVHGTPNMGVLFFVMSGAVAGLAAVTQLDRHARLFPQRPQTRGLRT